MISARICDWCGKPITKRNRHGARNNHDYCSAECANAARAKRVIVQCDWCGKPILKKRSDVKRCRHNFCDWNCYLDYTNFENAGARNQRVGGGVLYRRIAEITIGRKLLQNEEVHHLDGNHMNNNPENLVVVSASEHMKIHAKKRKRGKNGRFVK
jgi:cephalosporin hydroxylase